MKDLDAAVVLNLLSQCVARARTRALLPMSVVVLDSGGRTCGAVRESGAGMFGVDIASAKAKTALAFGAPSGEVGTYFTGRPEVVASLAAALDGQFLGLAGAVRLKRGGEIIGALAAAGDAPEKDEALVIEVAETAGFS